jgi:hypothetical protein
MKRYLLLFVLIVAILASCKKDDPERDIRDDYIGSYTGTLSWYEQGNLMNHDYDFTISKSAIYGDGLIFSNFADYGADVTAFIEVTRFIIPHQIIEDQEGYLYGIMGSGEFFENHVTFTFQESDVNYLFNISVIAYKK